ncbi:hypothetical protein NMK71_02150 [Weeksellaceae bacterium KMM 9713]|uniref:Secreted protein n=1 Tax=Profundicola chukchiensis TaxID=2961959 RepID=A0A9X4MUT0_9FLAO|nr:hypothetical protein [Profundicola chukchiensis]MDG4945203.1 hypothetical protein [Profundicola chukchiensis]MDG4950278.1 hypothetical protein [Profundicola chukchiensis]
MKNLFFTLAFMLIGTFAFASMGNLETNSIKLETEVVEVIKIASSVELPPCEYCVYATHGTFCSMAGDCKTARKKAHQQAQEALQPAPTDPQPPSSSFT